MSSKRKFTLAQILSITDGRLFCTMGEVYEILNHMTGDDLYTHVLPSAGKFAAPEILTQLPFLGSEEMKADLKAATEGIEQARSEGRIPEYIKDWNQKMAAKYGGGHELSDASSAWLSFDTVEEAMSMFGRDKVATVILDDK